MNTTNLLIMISVFLLFIILSIIYINLDLINGLFVGLLKKKRINAKLKKFAIDHDYPLLSDIVIQVRDDKYIKIDHIMIGDKYIYVIVTKSWYGYLNGKVIDEKWILYRNDKLIHLENPLKNNQKRIKVLSSLLESGLDDFVNIAYLSKPVVSSKIASVNDKEFVVHEDDFEKFIEIYEKECKLNDFSLKSIENSARKIYEYHKESLISFKEVNKKKEAK